MTRYRICLAGFCVMLILFTHNRSGAQSPPPAPPASQPLALDLTPAVYNTPQRETAGTTTPSSSWSGTPDGQTTGSDGISTESESHVEANGWFMGADYLLVRPHFSEATAFARGTQDASSMHITAQDIEFQYDSSFRVFGGYRFEGTDTELRLTYTRLTADTQDNAANFSPGHFAVDPFGNIVGVAVELNPDSARFGQQLVGGDRINTSSDLALNVFDIDVIKPIMFLCGGWELKYSAGVRIAQMHQSYQSVILDSGAYFAGGEYTADFTGAGPRVGLQTTRYFGRCRQYSIFAQTSGSILVGEYDMHFGQSTTSPSFQATQDTDDIRVLPVAEAEIGAGWSPIPWFNVSVGWLFQAWFDLGSSGGTFGGFYTVTENSNIMAFEGFFLRTELTF